MKEYRNNSTIQATDAVEISRVASLQNQIDLALSELSRTAYQLHGNLSFVLAPAEAKNEKKESSVSSVDVRLSQRMDTTLRTIIELNNSLADIISRLEV